MSIGAEQLTATGKSGTRGWEIWKIIIALTMAILVASFLVWQAWHLMNQPVPTPPDKLVFARDVYLFIDVTESLNHANRARAFDEIKKFAIEKILPDIGPGDRVSCYTIGTDFVEAENRVFQKSMPQVPERFLLTRSPASENGKPPDTRLLWEPVEQVLSPTGDAWPLRIGALRQQKGGSTNYLGALGYLAERLNSPERRSVREIYVVVLGDLLHEPLPEPFSPPPPQDNERQVFDGVHVELVVPYKEEEQKDSLPVSRTQIREYWQGWFAARGNDQPDFYTLGTAQPVLPSSHVPPPMQNLNVEELGRPTRF